MACTKFTDVKIGGIVTVVPEIVKCIDDEVVLYGGNEKQIARIKSAIGLDKRRVTNQDTTALDLCIDAAKALLKGLDVPLNTIEGLIFVTQTPDHFQPSNAAIAHGKLNLSKNVASFDINLGCSGYVYGLWMAHMMISSGTCSNVLLLAGDTISKYVNARDRSTAPLFGDAGSATIINKSFNNTESYFTLHTDGNGAEYIKVPAGAFRQPFSSATAAVYEDEDGNYRSANDLHMNGGEVFNFSISTEPKAINEILEYSSQSIDDVDYVIFHQANKYIISNIARRLKLPLEKVPCETVSKYGNQSSASIPCTINESLTGQLLDKKKRVILSGFGVGLSWASALIDLYSIYCPPVKIYNHKGTK